MSRIASPEVAAVEITPGGMMLSPTSFAPRRRLTEPAGATMPTASASTETSPTAPSCAAVGPRPRALSPFVPAWCPCDAPPASFGASAAKCVPAGRSVMRPCLMPCATIQALAGYATTKPTMTPSDTTPQKSSCSGSIARMSRPIISRLIVGAMPAIMKFMLMNSGRKLRRTFSR